MTIAQQNSRHFRKRDRKNLEYKKRLEMSQEVVNYKEMSTEEIMKLTGQSTGSNFIDFPRLYVNKDVGEDKKNQLPVGVFAVSQNGVAVYGEPVTFRPFINAYQYCVYDEPTKTFVNRSTIFKSFTEECLDELGGVACGRIPKSKREGITKEQLEAQDAITCYRILYGLVSFDGVLSDGTAMAISNVPVRLRLSGSNFMPLQEPLDYLSKKKIPMITANLTLTTERNQNGATIWWIIKGKASDKDLVNLGESDWDALRLFQESIDRENKAVMGKHRSSRRSIEAPTEAAEIIEALEASLSDDISDIGSKQ